MLKCLKIQPGDNYYFLIYCSCVIFVAVFIVPASMTVVHKLEHLALIVLFFLYRLWYFGWYFQEKSVLFFFILPRSVTASHFQHKLELFRLFGFQLS